MLFTYFRKDILRLAALTLAMLFSLPISAQNYPDRPVTLVVPFTPGSFSDLSARVYAKELGQIFGQLFVIENISGIAGIRKVKTSPPNGLVLLWHTNAATSSQAILANPDFDIRKDFVPVGRSVQTPLAIFVSNKSGFMTIKDVIEFAKKNPGKLNYGSAGVGSMTHLNAELFMKRAGIDMIHVPYKGGSAAYTALMAGEIDFLIYDPSFAAATKDKTRLVAILSKERWDSYKNLPTIEESGGPQLEANVWNGVFAPAGTPSQITLNINQAIRKAAESPDIEKYMAANGYEPAWVSQEDFKREVDSEVLQWSEVVRFANVPLQ